MTASLQLTVHSHAQAAAVWRALTHVPPDLLEPIDLHLSGYGYLWTLEVSSDDGQLTARRAAQPARTLPPAPCG